MPQGRKKIVSTRFPDFARNDTIVRHQTKRGRPLVAPTENSEPVVFFAPFTLFSVMLSKRSASKHLAEALQE